METLLAFAQYWRRVWPQARRELVYWRACAQQAPDRIERRIALTKLASEAHNIESIACFALLAEEWRPTLRRLVSFETAYELLDGLGEHYSTLEQGLRLHAVLVDAAGGPKIAYCGYLRLLADAARGPTSCVLVERARQIAEAQSLNHAGRDLREWGEAFAPHLSWWEAAAGGICSLGALAMLSTPPDLHEQVRMAYLPVDVLAALLDALVDLPHDRVSGNHNWLEHYPTEHAIGERVEALIVHAVDGIERLPSPGVHRLLLVGLLAHTLAAPGDHLPLVRLRLAKASRLVPLGALILRARHIPGDGRSGLCSIQN